MPVGQDAVFELDGGIDPGLVPDIITALDADPDALTEDGIVHAAQWREVDRFPASESLARMAAGMADPAWAKASRSALAAFSLWERSRESDADRKSVIHLLAEADAKAIGKRGPKLVHALAVDRVKHDGDPRVRAYAAGLLPSHAASMGMGGDATGIIAQAMREASRDPDGIVRKTLAEAIGSSPILQRDEGMAAILLSMADDPIMEVRAAAHRSLVSMMGDPDLDPAISGRILAWARAAATSGDASAARSAAMMVLAPSAGDGLVSDEDAEILLSAIAHDPSLAVEANAIIAGDTPCADGVRLRLIEGIGTAVRNDRSGAIAASSLWVMRRLAMEDGEFGDAAFALLSDLSSDDAIAVSSELADRCISGLDRGDLRQMEESLGRLMVIDRPTAIRTIRRACDQAPDNPEVKIIAIQTIEMFRNHEMDLDELATLGDMVTHLGTEATRLAAFGVAGIASQQKVPRAIASGCRNIELDLQAIVRYLDRPREEQGFHIEAKRIEEAAAAAAAAAILSARQARAMDLDGYGLQTVTERIQTAMAAVAAALSAKSAAAKAKAGLSQKQILLSPSMDDEQTHFVVTPDDSADARRFWDKALGGGIAADPIVARAMELELLEARMASGHAGGPESDAVTRWADRHAGSHAGVFAFALDRVTDPADHTYDPVGLSVAVGSGLNDGMSSGIGRPDPQGDLARALLANERVTPSDMTEIYRHGGPALMSGVFLSALDSPIAIERQKSIAAARGIVLGMVPSGTPGSWWGNDAERALNAARQVLDTGASDPDPKIREAARTRA